MLSTHKPRWVTWNTGGESASVQMGQCRVSGSRSNLRFKRYSLSTVAMPRAQLSGKLTHANLPTKTTNLQLHSQPAHNGTLPPCCKGQEGHA